MKDSNNLYTKEEIQELEHWFDSKELPKSLQLDKATYIPDLKETLHRLFLQADQCYENPKMQGCIYLLERIKAKLEE
ncbi:hypothetical protein QVO10_09050 [Bacteroides gallinaceum]|uniref:DUF6965 domain-containing protein n=2 Tax=Bacteroidaceae TaxID=815 RepID=A0ABT7X677_9BACE|nr:MULTISPECIES: hypothetical protein [Bacteroidaceae]HJD09949.1 hypothetical protein [Candidatus Phocaeicola caecigallinarum]MBD8041116.1 hypothetical protein [Phocaeicola intestinalis]MBM6657134.1 hypothetical protein [Bacteroides gallinaceum]MBM6718699.1 hypothetical protein [Bacteroides gallinaceum]MBM6945427.1 hypothetical protein [Bacteroides gallinaceum]